MPDTRLTIQVAVEGAPAATVEIKEVAGATQQVGQATEQTSKKTSGLAQSLKGMATGIAVYKGYQYVKSAVTATETLAKSTAGLQRITGMDTRTASGWVATAKERGIQSKQLNMGFTSLGRQMESANKHSKTAGAAFKALGIPLDQVRKMNTQQAIGAVSDALAKMPPGAEKAAAAQKIFGRAGQGLLPLLSKGSKALNEQMQTMGKTIGMNNKSRDSALQLAKQQREMSAQTMGLKIAVGSALIPILTQLAQTFTPILTAFAKLVTSSPMFRTAVLALAAAFAALKIAMFFGSGLATGGIIGLLVGIGVLLVTAYQKVGWFRNAVDAAFRFIKNAIMAVVHALPAFGPILTWVGHAFVTLKNIAVSVFRGIVTAARAIIGGISAAGHAVASAFGGGLRAVIGIAKGIWNTITGAAKTAASTIGGVLSGAFNGIKTAAGSVLSVVQQIGNTLSTIAHAPGKVAGWIGSHLPGMATGGVATRPTLSLVGEQGPEIVALPAGAAVYPNGSAPAGIAGGGGGTIHTHVYLDRREIASALGAYTADRQAAR